MKAGSLLLHSAIFSLLALRATPWCQAGVITFDDLSETGSGSYITSYQGLVWSNFFVENAILFTNFPFLTGPSGSYYGMVSPSNVCGNAFHSPSEIDSLTNFNFYSAYLTGSWNSNLNIEVQGFRAGNMLYDQTVVAAATNATQFTFNYWDIDRLVFSSFGGQNAGFSTVYGGENYVMDNLTFEFVPEPSALLLAGVGALLVWPLLNRKRA